MSFAAPALALQGDNSDGTFSITKVMSVLGISRPTVYRMLGRGRRVKRPTAEDQPFILRALPRRGRWNALRFSAREVRRVLTARQGLA